MIRLQHQAALRAVSLGAALTLATSNLDAQARTVVIPGAPACATCSIELTLVATTGKADDLYRFVDYSTVHRGPRNTIIGINSIGDSPAVFLLDSAGRFLKWVGRPGTGGPEFSGWAFMVGIGRGDSVYFRTRSGQNVAMAASLETGRVLAHATLGPIRVDAVRAYFDVALPNGTFIGQPTTASSGAAIGAPLVLMTDEGKLVKAVGEFTAEEGTYLPISGRSVSLTGGRTGFWVLRRNQYDLQRFTLDGEKDLTVKVEGSLWMKPWLQEPAPAYTSLEDVQDAGGGRVWIMGRGPATGVGSMLPPTTGTWPTQLERSASTVIEIIDVERGTLLASRRFEREAYSFIDGNYVARQRKDAAGLVSWDIYRISLRER